MAKFLDQDGLLYFWQKIKAKLAGKVDVESGKGLSSNDFTDALKKKLDGIADGAQKNVTYTGTSPISVSGSAISHANSGVTAAAKGDTANQTPGFGGTFKVTSGTVNATGHLTAFADHTVTIPSAEATDTTAGLMSAADKSKLNSMADGANNYTHPAYTARTGKPTGNQTPAFGATFTISQVASDATGHVTNMTDRTVKIPDTAMSGASADAAGSKGLVPAPAKGDQSKFLAGDGTWKAASFTDEKVKVTLATTTKAYLLATATTPTATAANVVALSDTGVYLDTTAGKLTAGSFAGNGASLTSLNASNLGSGTVPAARLPAASQSAQGAMSAADKKKLDAFGSASDYALKTDITSMYKHKGSVAAVANLPSTGQTAGDVYNVTATGMNYVWTGSEWDALGEIFTIDAITNTEIDDILAA